MMPAKAVGILASRSPQTGFREVKPPRRQKLTPSKQRRRIRRALERAAQTADAIDGSAQARLRARDEGRANEAVSRDGELNDLYGHFRGDRRRIYGLGVPEGTVYEGKPRRFYG